MTTSEFLDENEPEFHYRGLVVGLTAMTFCPPCGHVDEDITTRVDQPCGTCQTVCPRRRLLFSGSEGRLLSMIFECYKREDSRPLCVLLFCALTEHHLHYVTMRRCERLRLPFFVTRILLERHEQFDMRLRLLEELCGSKVGKSLPHVEKILATHRLMRPKRNQLAHGDRAAPFAITEEDIRASVDQAGASFGIFADLHHKYCSVDSSTVADIEALKTSPA
jgi:hypothetical protein